MLSFLGDFFRGSLPIHRKNLHQILASARKTPCPDLCTGATQGRLNDHSQTLEKDATTNNVRTSHCVIPAKAESLSHGVPESPSPKILLQALSYPFCHSITVILKNKTALIAGIPDIAQFYENCCRFGITKNVQVTR